MSPIIRQASRGVIIILFVGVILAGLFESTKRQRLAGEIISLTQIAQKSFDRSRGEANTQMIQALSSRIDAIEFRLAKLEQ